MTTGREGSRGGRPSLACRPDESPVTRSCLARLGLLLGVATTLVSVSGCARLSRLDDRDADAGTATSPCGCGAPVSSVPASENPTQLVTGATVWPSPHSAGGLPVPVVRGPFVLTDATLVGGSNGHAAVALLLEPASITCAPPDTKVFAGPETGSSVLATLAMGSYPASPDPTLASTASRYAAQEIHGGRYLVREGQMLCAYELLADPASQVAWAGFRPYS